MASSTEPHSSTSGAAAPTGKGKTGFLDLPRELRDIIYDFILVPGEPIEFAPLYVCLLEFEEPSRNLEEWTDDVFEIDARITQSDLDECLVGASWYLHRYITEIQPTLSIMRTNRQMHEEAAAVYYGQEFRFSNPSGWYIVNEWLRTIGPANRTRIRHLIVAHPGQKYPPHYTDYQSSPVPTSYPLSDREYQRVEKYKKNNVPEEMILELTELRTLRFTLFNRFSICSNVFAKLSLSKLPSEHPNPNLQVSVINLRYGLYGRGA